MKKYDHIRPVTDNTAAEPAPVPPGGYTGVEPLPEDAEIDRILKLTADELTAEVDFAGIRERALKSAKAAKAKRGKLRRAVSYGLFAAASVFFGFALFTVLGKIHTAPHGNVDVLNTQSADTDEGIFRGMTPGTDPNFVRRTTVGTVSEEEAEEIVNSVSELLPDALPDSMTTLVDQGSSRVCASGVDDEGTEVSYVCSIENSSPIALAVGQVGAMTDGEDTTYYWQLADGQFISMHFSGFEVKDADSMFESIAKRITEGEAPAETTAPAETADSAN